MKIILLTIIALGLLSAVCDAQYHIRVVQNDVARFRIEYTNNNWKTIEKIKAFSGTSFGQYNFMVKQDALDFAHGLTNYNMCNGYVNNQKALYYTWLSHNKDYFNKSIQVY